MITAMPANWPRCTAVQLALLAYSANTTLWLLAGPSAWRNVATIKRMKPTASNTLIASGAPLNKQAVDAWVSAPDAEKAAASSQRWRSATPWAGSTR
jgi:hypothetical protein